MIWELGQIQENAKDDTNLHLAIQYILKQLNTAEPWNAKWPFCSKTGDFQKENNILLRAARFVSLTEVKIINYTYYLYGCHILRVAKAVSQRKVDY